MTTQIKIKRVVWEEAIQNLQYMLEWWTNICTKACVSICTEDEKHIEARLHEPEV